MSIGAVALLVVRFGLRQTPAWFTPVSAIGVFALTHLVLREGLSDKDPVALQSIAERRERRAGGIRS